jgi:hypothetical protein
MAPDIFDTRPLVKSRFIVALKLSKFEFVLANPALFLNICQLQNTLSSHWSLIYIYTFQVNVLHIFFQKFLNSFCMRYYLYSYESTLCPAVSLHTLLR